MADEEKGFLSRWSQRKRQQQSQNPNEPDDDPTDLDARNAEAERAEAERVEREEQEKAEAEINRVVAESVDLDAISYGDDFSMFLKRGVPDQLRKKALRTFFNSSPILANLDGLNDYDEDFNNPAHKVYKSAWNATRGFLTENEQLLQQATGGITQKPDALEGLSEEPEVAAEAMEETSEAELASDTEIDTEAETQASDGNEADEIVAESDGAPEEEPAHQKRISIRQRLNG